MNAFANELCRLRWYVNGRKCMYVCIFVCLSVCVYVCICVHVCGYGCIHT